MLLIVSVHRSLYQKGTLCHERAVVFQVNLFFFRLARGKYIFSGGCIVLFRSLRSYVVKEWPNYWICTKKNIGRKKSRTFRRKKILKWSNISTVDNFVRIRHLKCNPLSCVQTKLPERREGKKGLKAAKRMCDVPMRPVHLYRDCFVVEGMCVHVMHVSSFF